MRRVLLNLGALVAALAVTAPAVSAHADPPSFAFRADLGEAFPLTKPQSQRFFPGGDLVLKPTIDLTPWFDASAVLSGMVLGSQLAGYPAGTEFGIGVGGRLKRPHADVPAGNSIKSVAPWIDADAQFVRTGALDRAALAVAIGVSFPVNNARDWWIGPFARYSDTVQDKGHPGFNNADAHVLIFGISLELDPAKHAAVSAPVVVNNPPPAPPPEAPAPPPAVIDQPAPAPAVVISQVIQFPFDSNIPLPSSQNDLDTVTAQLIAHPGWFVEIDGHASSEGQVAHNDALSLQRAQTVAAVFVASGVAQDHITVKGFGSRVPVAPNDTEADRAKNRRTDFVVTVVVINGGSQ